MGTVALEPGRWNRKGRENPVFKASAFWSEFEKSGFDGWELWDGHYLGHGEDEATFIETHKEAFPIFNSYETFGKEPTPHAGVLSRAVEKLRPAGIKFNVAKDPDLWKTHLEKVSAWWQSLPESTLPICEVHPGTVIEEPENAQKFFRELGKTPGIIIHGLNADESFLHRWFDCFSTEEICHCHIQLRENTFAGEREKNEARVQWLKEKGFRGSWTFEFLKGTATAGETPEQHWNTALQDLKDLRKILL